MKGTEAQRI
jgi:hypothetical protein